MENQENLQEIIKKERKKDLQNAFGCAVIGAIGAELLDQPWYIGALAGTYAYLMVDQAYNLCKPKD
ncbi:hypothetical protein HN865_04870 [Candidatus Woesearchaeota archaeon]|jgi:hypothetical protein|nr:hypothetical protein [Candidatus Woesearchaeota archaeon]